MSAIKPTVGRVVLFVPKTAKYEFGFCFVAGRAHAALVTAVHGDRCVNIAAFDANGKSYGFTSVTLRQTDDPAPDGDYCEWMPYQLGQAAKTEAAEKALAAKG
jgi:hypothetical protein